MRDSADMNLKPEITLTGRHFELTESIENRVNEMVEKLGDHDVRIESIRVELDLERHATSHHDEFSAKATVGERKEVYMASAKGDELYAVIGDLEQKLDRLIRRKNRRRIADRRHPKGIELSAEASGTAT